MTPFTETQIVFICHEVLQGLKFLHSIGIIHRDIKASNILVNQSGQVKIGDFGRTSNLFFLISISFHFSLQPPKFIFNHPRFLSVLGCCDSINPEFRKYNFVGTPHWYFVH